ncbi:hypothetical protein ACTAB2_05655 [Pseudomonas syringae]|uniref:hypothetical protein n=1 Tax=Pseudomonas syringae TaxID=317 RepID=UPI003F7AC21F
MDSFTVKPKWIIFPDIHVEANAAHDSKLPIQEGSFDIGCTFNVDNSDSTLHASVYLTNESDNEELNLEYKIDIHIYSVFLISEAYEGLTKKVKLRVLEDISNTLIGSLRDMIITITSRGPWGSYILPFLDVKQLALDMIESQSAKKD